MLALPAGKVTAGAPMFGVDMYWGLPLATALGATAPCRDAAVVPGYPPVELFADPGGTTLTDALAEYEGMLPPVGGRG